MTYLHVACLVLSFRAFVSASLCRTVIVFLSFRFCFSLRIFILRCLLLLVLPCLTPPGHVLSHMCWSNLVLFSLPLSLPGDELLVDYGFFDEFPDWWNPNDPRRRVAPDQVA
jgi:hypothetical protein